ncbi:hypothetical protein BZG36_04701 [Bifiguratus adelaidae]|uniref:PAN2-PAN3 deadenylation complex subunit PAN3 n=1 Tax=Bifiguratus adelaidae TaxID=1938954 RepID=A0A261XV75_9FUNG|nr:hypothetical protein BZG36_04701 [Bifiguratus adelaidae]
MAGGVVVDTPAVSGGYLKGRQLILPLALALVISLFFLWGFAYGLLDVLNSHFQIVMGITKLQSTGLQVAYYGGGYLYFSPIAGTVLKKWGYKRTIIMGLGLYAIGAILFWPCAKFSSPSNAHAAFAGFVVCTLIIACGLATLEVSANSYATVIGSPEWASFRLQFCQSFNGVASFAGPFIASKYFFSDGNADNLTNVQWVYLAVACVGAALAVIFYFFPLPEVSEASLAEQADKHAHEDGQNSPSRAEEPFHKQQRLIYGFIAQFMYVGAQVTVATFFLNYTKETVGWTQAYASNFLSYSLIMFTVGRFFGTALLTVVSADLLLFIYATICALLSGVVASARGSGAIVYLMLLFWFESIQYPVIFVLGTTDLGTHTRRGAALIVMGVSGGAVFPSIQGAVADVYGTHVSYIVTTPAYLTVASFAAFCWFQDPRHLLKKKDACTADIESLKSAPSDIKEVIVCEKVSLPARLSTNITDAVKRNRRASASVDAKPEVTTFLGIEFDGGSHVIVRPNRIIRGTVKLTNTERLYMTRVRIKFRAEEIATVKVEEGSGDGKGVRIHQLITTFFETDFKLWGNEATAYSLATWDELEPGQYKFPFALKFPNVNYPPSVEEPNGFSVRYIWTAQIDGPGGSSGLRSKEFITPYRPIIVAPPDKEWTYKTTLYKDRKTPLAEVQAKLGKQAYCPDEPFSMKLTLTPVHHDLKVTNITYKLRKHHDGKMLLQKGMAFREHFRYPVQNTLSITDPSAEQITEDINFNIPTRLVSPTFASRHTRVHYDLLFNVTFESGHLFKSMYTIDFFIPISIANLPNEQLARIPDLTSIKPYRYSKELPQFFSHELDEPPAPQGFPSELLGPLTAALMSPPQGSPPSYFSLPSIPPQFELAKERVERTVYVTRLPKGSKDVDLVPSNSPSAIPIVAPSGSKSPPPGKQQALKSNSGASRRLCRNIIIHGYCKYEGKGCEFSHDVVSFGQLSSPVQHTHEMDVVLLEKTKANQGGQESPRRKGKLQVTSPTFKPANGGNSVSADSVNAPVFVPKQQSMSNGTPNFQRDQRYDAGMVAYESTAAFLPEQGAQGSPYNVPSNPMNDPNLGPMTDSFAQFGFGPEGMPGQAQMSIAQAPQGGYGNNSMYTNGQVDPYYYGPPPVMAHQPREQLQYHLYTNPLPHVSNLQAHQRSIHNFSIADNLRETLQKKNEATIATVQVPDLNLPSELHVYHTLSPLEDVHTKNPQVFGYPTSLYKAVCTVDGRTYALRRVEGFRLTNEMAMSNIESWRRINHPNICSIREAFTTKAFSDHSLIFVYDFHPCSETLLAKHFPPSSQTNGVPAKPLWSYITQLTSALKSIHSAGLAARVIDPSKIILTGKNRIRLGSVGIFDVVQFDNRQNIARHQQDDLLSFGKLLISLACGSLTAFHNLPKSFDYISRHHTPDMKNLILYLLSKPSPTKSIDEVIGHLAPRLLQEVNNAESYNDVLESELSRELENGRINRLLMKMAFINERPEFDMDPSWSETGDRYIIKLFRDYVFHQVDENGVPVVDVAHVLTCLNKLDAGVDEKLMLVSRDEQSCLIVSYREIKSCIITAFNDLSSGRR